MEHDKVVEHLTHFDPKPPPGNIPAWVPFAAMAVCAAVIIYPLLSHAQTNSDRLWAIPVLVFFGILALANLYAERRMSKLDKEVESSNQCIRSAALAYQAHLAQQRGQIH